MRELYRYKVRMLLLLMMAAVLVACSDDADSVEGETDTLQLVPYTHGRTEVSPSSTRAVTLPTDDYSPYLGPNTIGVFTTTTDGDAPDVRTFWFENGHWNSRVNVINSKTYYIYGYMPVKEDIHCEISQISGKDYSQGAVLTFTNLPPVLAEDFSVVSGVLQVNSSNLDNEEGSLAAGNFRYDGKASGSNFVCLMLDHLYSAVQFKFLVKDTYNELRTIKLKKVEMMTDDQLTYPLTVTMKDQDQVGYEVSWGTGTTLSNDYISLYTNDDGETLSTSVENATLVNGYFAPMSDVASKLKLRCTYDVYDKDVTTEHPDGNLVRENCTAVNKLSLTYGPNQRTKLTLTVNPTYLYVLSDPDLDNPTIVVN